MKLVYRVFLFRGCLGDAKLVIEEEEKEPTKPIMRGVISISDGKLLWEGESITNYCKRIK